LEAHQLQRKGFLSISFVLLSLIFLSACQNKNPDKEHQYGLITYDSLQGKVYFTGISSLTGQKEIKQGPEISYNGFILTQRNGRYYVMDNEQKLFVCYKASANNFNQESSISMKDIPWEPYMSWINYINEHTILIGTVNKRKFSYIEIDLEAMKIKRHGALNVPAPPDTASNYAGVSAQLVKDKLFISYTFQRGMMREHIVPCNDTLFMAQFNYPELQLQSTTQDHRTTWPGSYTILAPCSMVYKDNVYVLGQPGGRTGNHKTAPSSILKLDTKTNKFDPEYNFEIANPIREEAYTLHDMGYGLALTSVVQSSKIHSFMNYMVNRVANYVLLDLEQQKKIELNLPDVQLDWIFNTIWDNDSAYFSVYQKDGKSQIWQYNRKSGKLQKGASIKGAILRIDRL